MADFPFEILTKPISDDLPCGPDLELENDVPYLNFVTRADGMFPDSFFDFDRSSIDFDAELATCAAISRKSIDFRVLVPFAKLLILNRDVRGFQQCLSAIATLLEERWESVHPQPMDGDSSFRGSVLQALDDPPQTVFPLQCAPLFKTRRFGPVMFRHHLLVEKSIPPRKVIQYSDDDGSSTIDEEKVPQAADLRGAIGDVELADLVGIRDIAEQIVGALEAIEKVYDEKSGKVGFLRFKELKALATPLFLFLDSSVALRDPAQARNAGVSAAGEDDVEGEDGQASAPQPGQHGVTSPAEALAAIRAAADYFARKETTNPARLWLAQAQALVGKSFYDALRALVPDYAGQASVTLTRELPLTLPVERLSELLPEELPPEDDGAEETEASADNNESSGEGDEAAADGEDAAAEPAAPVPQAKVFVARDRMSAIRLIESASAFIRIAEPSSPIPMLLDQAKASSARDFISLLRDVLPQSALRID